MIRVPRLLGAVLAGGEGRRFGGPKAEASVGGVPMVERAVSAVKSVVGDVVVVSARTLRTTSAPVVADRIPGAGPAAFLNVNTTADRVRAEAALVATQPTDAERSAG